MTQKVDILLINTIVLTMDADYQLFEPGAVAIQGDTIIAAGLETEICQAYAAKEKIDCQGKVLMPGLINAHTHVSMNLLRGLADDLRLDVWLMGYMMPVEREFVSPEFVVLGAKLAAAELIRTGVTCFNDMYYFEEDVAKAIAEVGLRAICGQTVLKFPSPDAQSYEESLGYAREFIQRWKNHPLIVPAVCPHAPYTCTEEILKAAAELAVEFDVPLHTHISETALEVENMRKEQGMPVVPYIKKQNLFDAKVIAAHCVHIDDGEIYTLTHRNVGVAHNPSSNLKLASGTAPVSRMLEAGLNVGIGTDSSDSNNDLDMFEEIRLASFLAKVATGDPTVLPAKTTLNMATHMGAKALHMGELIGSLEPGKRADLILVDLSNLHNTPRFRRDSSNIYAKLVYAGKSTDVTDVMVNGKWLMRDRQLLTLNETELLAQANEYAGKIDAFLIEREQSVLSKLIAIEGVEEEESFEVQAKVSLEDITPILASIEKANIEILHHRHYHQFDTYFHFEDTSQGLLRYREDEISDVKNRITNMRYRLTLIGRAREGHFPSDVLLSRSRYLAPATHSLRFYREYFEPSGETFIEKERQRWRVLYKGTEFYINLDQVKTPDLGIFLEVKSRTWSRRDAENKAYLVTELITVLLGRMPEEMVTQDYLELVSDQENHGKYVA
ncbi:MAG: amidohydrolase [Anaerolineales bacterium]|nr:amidohydrolase [Anaerolineales bacterium]